MEKVFRKTGIDIIGDAPWGTHICQFYQTKKDLIDILIPYFKAGLENNEFCMWVTSEPLKVEDAKAALKKVVKNLDHFIKKGQIEILDYSEWYTKSGKFDANNVLQSWVEKENQALKRGYDGLRLSGNTFWLAKRDWRNFTDYEEEVNNVISKYRMIAICTYSLGQCGASKVIDVVSNHQFALIRREGKWVIIESSDRKRAEEALRERKEFVENLIASSQDGFSVLDSDGVHIDVNPAFCQMTGFSREELMGVGLPHPYWPPEAYEEIETAFQKTLRGEFGDVELTFMRKNGERFPVIVSPSWVKDKQGNVTSYFATVKDITERKRAEETLKTQARVLENMVEGVNVSDENGIIFFTNPALDAIFGYERGELIGKHVSTLNIYSPEDNARFVADVIKQLKTKRAWFGEVSNRKKDGTPFYTYSRVSGLEISGKAYWISVQEDITERKRAEESLRESEEKYRNLVESISDIVYTIDSSGVLTYISPVVKNTLGYEPDELIGRQFLEFVHKEDHDLLMRRFSELREGIIRHSDYRVIGKHGDIKWVRTLTNPIIEEGGFAGARGVLIDITERKQTEEALKKSEERFRTSVETLLEGFAILSAVRDSNGQLIDFKYEYINEAGCKMNQKPHEEHMGKTLLELLPTHKEIGLFDEYVRVVETGQSLTKEFLIYETVYGSGERLRQAFDVRITRLGNGFVTTWQDITDKKKGDELLRQSEERLRLLIENSKDVVIMADLEGNITYYNGPPEYGITAEEALGKNPFSIFEPVIAARLMNQLKLVMKGGEALTFENVIPWRGESFWFLNQMYPIWDEKGRMITVGLIARNITERKQAEEALRKSEEKYRTVADFTYDWEYWVGLDRNFIYISPSCERVTGYRPEEFFANPNLILTIVHPDDRRMIAQHNNDLFDREEVDHLEFRINTRSGEELWISHICQPVYSNDGSFLGRRGSNRDITKRKRAEEALRESEMTARALMDSPVDSILVVNPDGIILDTNQTFAQRIGRCVDELIGRCVYDFFPPELVKSRRARVDEIVHFGVPIRFEDERAGIQLDHSAHPICDTQGKVTKIAIVARDITERKQAEEGLRRAEENFRRSLDDSPLGVRIVTTEGETVYANRAILDIYGYDSIEELRTTPVKKRYTPESYAEFQIRKKKRQRGEYDPPEYEISIVRENGEVRHLQVFRKEVLWNGEKQYQVIYRDITERKQAEERILTYQDQLHSLMTELSLIEERERRHIATELHDNISQTLAITKIKLGMAQGLTSSTDWVGSLNEIGELIDQAVQYTRSLTFELSPPILYELGLEAAAEWLTEQIQEKHGIQIGFEDDRQSKPIKDEIRLSLFKATKELLINIVKHAQASKAKVSIWREDNSIRIRVEDDGVGFSTSKDKQLGKTTGFGLFNIRERIKYLRGNIEIKSEPGGGTQITLSAPLEEKED